MRLRIDEPTPSYGDCTPEEATVLHIHELKNDGTFIMETLMTFLMSGRLTPSPNALVETMQVSSPERKADSTRVRSARERLAL